MKNDLKNSGTVAPNPVIECLLEEKKMISFLADKLWDIMTISELSHYFTDNERDTIEAISNHFGNQPEAVVLHPGEKEWNKTL